MYIILTINSVNNTNNNDNNHASMVVSGFDINNIRKNSKVALLFFSDVLILTYVKYKKRKCSHGISGKSKTCYSIQSKRL